MKRGVGQGHMSPYAHSFKTAKGINFKFGTQDHRDSPDMTLKKVFEMVRGQGHVTP